MMRCFGDILTEEGRKVNKPLLVDPAELEPIKLSIKDTFGRSFPGRYS